MPQPLKAGLGRQCGSAAGGSSAYAKERGKQAADGTFA